LSYSSASDVGGLKTDYAGNPYDHYALDRACNQDKVKRDVDYFGSDLRSIAQVEDAESCGKLCAETVSCKSWTYIKAPTHAGFKTCHLKSSDSIAATSDTCCDSGLQDACSDCGNWQHTANAAISGHNNVHLEHVTIEQCKSSCCANLQCKSFDYYKHSSQCDLSYSSASDVGGLKTDYAGNPYDHYALDRDSSLSCSYKPLRGLALDEGNLLTKQVGTLDNAKMNCEERDMCQSFAFCTGVQEYYLYDKRISSDERLSPRTDCTTHSKVCSAKPGCGNWQHTANAAISGHNNVHLEHITIEQCKDSCCANPQCKSFDYYKHSSQCDLSYSSASDVGGLKTDYAGNPYDHYALDRGFSPNPGPAAPVIPIGGNYPNFPLRTWGQYEVEYEGQTCSVKSYAGDYFHNALFKVSNLGLAQCSDATTVFAGKLHILPYWFRDTEFNLFVECPNGVCTATIPIGIGLDACDAIMFAATLGTGNAATAVKSTSSGIGAAAKQLYKTLKDTAKTLKTTVKNLASTKAPGLTRALKKAQKAHKRYNDAQALAKLIEDKPSGSCETYGGYASQLLKANERTASLGDIVDDLLAVIGDLFGSVYISIDLDLDLVINHRIFGGNSNAPFPVTSQASKLTLGWKFGTAFCAMPQNAALCIAIGVLTDLTHDLKICTHVEFVFDFPTATQVLGGKSQWKDVSIEFKCLESASATEIALESWNKLETLIKSVGIDTDKLGLSGITNGLEFFDETLSGYRERLCPNADFTNVVGNALFLDKVFPIERAICTQGNHGTFCLRNYECKSKVCSFARCANKGDIGSICNTHSDCISNYCSNKFRCSDKSNGSSCALNRDCNSNRCELGRGGKCVARENNGHICNEDSDCLSNNCRFFFCADPVRFFGRRLMQHELMSNARKA